jgi:hypothetical protein
VLTRSNLPPLLVNLDSVASTSKTYVLLQAYKKLLDIVSKARKADPSCHVALTSITAYNFKGSTLYRLFRILVKV